MLPMPSTITLGGARLSLSDPAPLMASVRIASTYGDSPSRRQLPSRFRPGSPWLHPTVGRSNAPPPLEAIPDYEDATSAEPLHIGWHPPVSLSLDCRALSFAARRWRNTLHHSSGFSRRPSPRGVQKQTSATERLKFAIPLESG